MAHISGDSPGIEDEHIDVDSSPMPVYFECHRCQLHHHHHQPNCAQLHPSCIDQARLNFPIESEVRIERTSDDKVFDGSASELRSLSSLTTEDPNSSEKRCFDSSSSNADGSLSSGASSSSSAHSSPSSSPSHKNHQRLSNFSSYRNPSSLGVNKSDEIIQRRLQTCPSNAGMVVSHSAPAPATNFLIEEILKPGFGVSSKFVQSTTGFIKAWNRSYAPEDGLNLSQDLLIRRGLLPFRPGLSSQIYEPFLISRVSGQEVEDAADSQNVTRKRKQSKPSEENGRMCLDLRRKVDLKNIDRKLSPRTFESLETRNVGAPCSGLSPNEKSSSRCLAPASFLIQVPRSQAPPLVVQTEISAFKLVACSKSSSNDCCSNSSINSSSSSSSHASSHVSVSMQDDNRKPTESDLHPCLSASSSASLDASASFQSQQLPAWVYCTRYSDRPSSGPRSRKARPRMDTVDDKRPRTAFTNDQLQILKREFAANQYLNEDRRHALATKLNLNETQIKIWFQNKRAKLKKASGVRNRLALELMAQGLYNHSTVTDAGDFD